MPKNNPAGYKKPSQKKEDPKKKMGTPEWRKERMLDLIPGRRLHQRITKGK